MRMQNEVQMMMNNWENSTSLGKRSKNWCKFFKENLVLLNLD